MIRIRKLLYLSLVLLGTQLSTGCYLGLTNRTVLFPGIAYPAGQGLVNAGSGCCYGSGSGCGTSLLNGPAITGGCGYSAPAYAGPVHGGASYAGPVYGGASYASPMSGGYAAPMYGPIEYAPSVGPGYDAHHGGGGGAGAGGPGCAGCGGGVPIAGVVGGPPIAVSPPTGGGAPIMPAGGGGIPQVMPSGPISGVPFDSGIVPTVKAPTWETKVADTKVIDTKKMLAGK